MPSPEENDLGLAARRVLSSSPVEGADEVEVTGDVVRLRGKLPFWDDVVGIGHAVAEEAGLSNLVCEVRVDAHYFNTMLCRSARRSAAALRISTGSHTTQRSAVCCSCTGAVDDAGNHPNHAEARVAAAATTIRIAFRPKPRPPRRLCGRVRAGKPG